MKERSEDRNQKSEVGSQRSEVRGQRSEVRGQMSLQPQRGVMSIKEDQPQPLLSPRGA